MESTLNNKLKLKLPNSVRKARTNLIERTKELDIRRSCRPFQDVNFVKKQQQEIWL